jgi:hypothetical protein
MLALSMATVSVAAYADRPIPAVKDKTTVRLSANGGACEVSLKRNQENGALEMYLDGKKAATDVTSLIALKDAVIYATGPIYGEPKISSLTCGNDSRTLVMAKNTSKYYPAGIDYFELEKYDAGTVSYLYIRDIDSPDLEKMRSAKHKGPWRRTLMLAK